MTTTTSQAERLSLSNPNLTISQLFKKITRSSYPVEGKFFPWYIFLTPIPLPLIFLKTWKTENAHWWISMLLFYIIGVHTEILPIPMQF